MSADHQEIHIQRNPHLWGRKPSGGHRHLIKEQGSRSNRRGARSLWALGSSWAAWAPCRSSSQEQDPEDLDRNPYLAKSRGSKRWNCPSQTKCDPRKGWGRGGSEEGLGRRRWTVTGLMAAWKEGWPHQMQCQNSQGEVKQDPTKALQPWFLIYSESLISLKMW